MTFDKSRVYTALNADELKVGSKVITADDLATLKSRVINNNDGDFSKLEGVDNDYEEERFVVNGYHFNLAYLISEPEEKKLKWHELKVGDILREKNGTQTSMVTSIDTSNEPDEEGDVLHICLGDWWPSDSDLEDWEKVEE